MGIGERLTQALNTLGLSIKDAADKAGMPYRSMQNYLRNEREPNAEAITKIRTHLGIVSDWLLTGEGEMFTDPTKSPTPAAQHEPYVSPMARKTAEMMSGWTEEEQKEFFKRVEEKYKQIENQKKQAEEMEALKAQMQELERLLNKSA
ncbi:helix-turn-helix domain-containing protein [Shewanella xiamenensis]|uniref:helix-turn-helix domain-containing protein n=1 Tax=Shewanella xiamenensis TaxID=332186 RepID=UPI000849E034|nr:helix-turn-helix domain-containing protein [Shewanella xiamenensis]ODR86717.1 hypothetical protein ABT47_16100 [Shewanella xiamenensis]